MKKVLLGTTALLGAGLVAGSAYAADGIKLAVGGFFRTAYQMNFDGDVKGEFGDNHNIDGVFSDAEVHFKGETTLDNGLTVGARVELEGETHSDQIDEAYVYFSGGFGKFEIGSDDEALASMCVTPPGGTVNFGAFSPDQIATNAYGSGAIGISSNTVCTGVDNRADAQKLIYFTPVFGGFQLGLSYTPDAGVESQVNGGGGAHTGMHLHQPGQARHDVSAYGTYGYEGDGWGLTFGAGASFQGSVEPQGPGTAIPDPQTMETYQTGLNLTFGNFAIGGAFQYFNDYLEARGTSAWVAGGGIAYTVDAWTVGLQYSHASAELVDAATNSGSGDHNKIDRVVATGNYAMGPGINLDAEVGYTWVNTADNNDPNDSYDSVELGIGTAFTF